MTLLYFQKWRKNSKPFGGHMEGDKIGIGLFVVSSLYLLAHIVIAIAR